MLAYCEREKPAFRSIYPEKRALVAPPKPLSSLIADSVDGWLFAENSGGCHEHDGTKWQDWSHLSGILRAARHGRLLICGDTCLIRSATDPSDPGIDLGKYAKAYGDSVLSAALLDDEVILVVTTKEPPLDATQQGNDGKATLLHIAFTARGLAVTLAYEVPNYIGHLAFADTNHGVARFRYRASYTTDGGKNWLHRDSVSSTGKIACWSEGCTVGDSLPLTRTSIREPAILGEYEPNDVEPAEGSSSSESTDAKKDDGVSEPSPIRWFRSFPARSRGLSAIPRVARWRLPIRQL